MTSGAPLTSLARPSGNITGAFPQQIELAKKRLQIFKEALPDLQTSTMLWDASSEDQLKATSATAGEFGLRLVGVELRERPYDYEAALTQAPPDHRGAQITPTFAGFLSRSRPHHVERDRTGNLGYLVAGRRRVGWCWVRRSASGR
jgi:hypothetical protein